MQTMSKKFEKTEKKLPFSILVFDLETTGLLDTPNATITEVGMVKWLPLEKRIVEATSFLMAPQSEDFKVPEEITVLTGITTTMVKLFSYGSECMNSVFSMMKSCDAIMARNGVRFDWPMLQRVSAKLGIVPPELTLIDDYYDIPYPSWVKGRSLSYVAADHGFLNPFSHSVIGDAMTLVKVMEVGKYDMLKAYESARSPIVHIEALVDFNGKDKAKDTGFKWNPDVQKWVKQMRQHQFAAIEFPFPTQVYAVHD